MTYANTHARSGLTAMAAVLALSSTSLAAQEVTPPADPITEPSPAPAPTADPLGAEPGQSHPAASEPAASQAEPAAAKPAAKRQAARAPVRGTAPSQPARSAVPASPPRAPEAVANPIPQAPLPATPIAEPAPPPAGAEPVSSSYALTADEALPIAGATGLGLLVLAGAGLAARRRRRRDELEHYQANETYLAEHPAEPEPSAREWALIGASQPMAAASPSAAVRTDVPRTKLPEGFDLTRFGPYTRAAYLGPTPDNPSLSLKYRLRKAAALDQRARLDAETRATTKQTTIQADPSKQPAWALKGDGFMLRRAGIGKPAQPVLQN